MPIEPGTRLGRYEILEPIAAEGSERYKASDTQLHRLVAITLLPPAFSERPELRQRLERDAQAISLLPDSSIGGPIEVGHEEPSTNFVVAEYLEGESLAERLARGPMNLDEALETAIAIAESLHQAHRHGVIHGGLTPSTVMLTGEGVRLLDFGMAGLFDEFPGPGSDAGSAGPRPSIATTATTRTFASAVTGARAANAAYMAPEQLAGGVAGSLGDIFSFGTILYEMVTGRRAFEEKTPALLIAAIQSVDPEPVSKLQPMAPEALDHVVARCLSKDPAQRLQTARDLVRQLHWIAEGGSQIGLPATVVAHRRKRDRLVSTGLAVGVLSVAILAASVWTSLPTGLDSPAVRFTVAEMPLAATVPITVSPDGRWIAGSPGGGTGMVGVLLDSVTPQQLAPDNIVTQPFWSPDSRSIAFFEDGLLKRLDVAGGPATTIAEAPPPVANGTWSADGVILFSSGGIIQRVLAAGGEPTPVTALDASLGETAHLGPSFLPDGRHYVYVAIAAESAIYLADLDSGERTRLFAADSKPAYAAPGYILFNRANTLFAQPFDPDALTLTGEPLRITDGVYSVAGAPITPAALTGSGNFAVSQTGVLVFKAGTASAGDATASPATSVPQYALEWRDRSGLVEPAGPVGAYAGVDLSPSGDRFAVHLHETEGGNSWTFDLEQGRLQQLTFNAAQHNASPIWARDGERIAFASERDGQWGLYVKRADGTGAEELVFESGTPKMPMSWSADDSLLVYSEGMDVWAVPIDGGDPFPVLDSPANELFPSVSPDGQWILYQSDETGQVEIYIQQFPEGPTKRRVSVDGGIFPRWRGEDGGEIYYAANGSIWAVAVDFSGASPQPGIPQMLFPLLNPTLGGGGTGPLGGIADHPLYHRFAVTADGQRFLLPRPGDAGGGGGGIDETMRSLAEAGGASGVTAVTTVILNWPAMLEER